MAKKEIIIDTRLEGVGRTQEDLNKVNDKIKDITSSSKTMKGTLQDSLSTINDSTQLAGDSFMAFNAILLLTNSSSEEYNEIMIKLSIAQVAMNSIMKISNALRKENNILTVAGATATKVFTATQLIFTKATAGVTTAMQVLRVAMLALPILLIISGIVMLISWLAKLASSTKEMKEANEALTKSYDDLADAQNREADIRERSLQRHKEYMAAIGASADELDEIEREIIEERERRRQIDLQRNQDYLNKLEAQLDEARRKGKKKLIEDFQEQVDAQKGTVEQLIDQQGDYHHSINMLNAKQADRIAKDNERRAQQAQQARDRAIQAQQAEQEKALAMRKKYEQDLLSIQDSARDIYLNNIKDARLREEAILIESYDRQMRMLIEEWGEESELIIELEKNREEELRIIRDRFREEDEEKEKENERRRQLALSELKIASIVEQNEKEKELYLQFLEESVEAEKEYLALMLEIELENENLLEEEKELIRQEYANRLVDIEKEKEEKITALAKSEEEERLRIRQQSMDSIMNLNETVFNIATAFTKKGSEEEEKVAKRKFQVNKALQLGMAVINGIQAVQSSLAQSPIAIGPIPNPAGIASLALAVTTGVANVAKIMATKYNASGGGGASSGASVPSAPNINSFNPADMYPTGEDIPQIEDERDEDNNIRVVLLDSELKARQNNNKKVDTISRG